MNKERYIVYFTQFSLLQHLRLNTKRIAFARECIFIKSSYQRPVWIFNSRHAALSSAFSLPYISLNLHLAKLHNPRLRQGVVRALYPLYRGCRFPAPNGGYIFYIFDPRTSCRYAKNHAAPKKAISGRAAEQQSKPACRSDTMPSYARGFCRVGLQAVLCFPFGLRGGGLLCVLWRWNAEKTYGLYRFDTEIVQHLQFQKSIFLHIVLFG